MLPNTSPREDVARILPLGDGRNFELRGQLRGQVLQAVDGQVDAAFRQGVFDFLGEHALGADLGQRHVGDLVAGSLDDFQLDLVTPSRSKAAM